MIEKLKEYNALVKYISKEDYQKGISIIDSKDSLLEDIVEKINEIISVINQTKDLKDQPEVLKEIIDIVK